MISIPTLTNNILRKIIRRLKSMLLASPPHKSETSKCRLRLAPFCNGYGVDLGFGGDPINPAAIRVDMPRPYANVGNYPVQLGGNAANLDWFRDGSLDYVYSSHLLEDFDHTKEVVREWLRVIKPGGHLVIFCPDEQVFRRHCIETGQAYNPNHKHAHFSLHFLKTLLAELGQRQIIHEAFPVNIYSFDLVIRKA